MYRTISTMVLLLGVIVGTMTQGAVRAADAASGAVKGNAATTASSGIDDRADDERLLMVVNYARNQSQCHVRLPFADLGKSKWRLKDLLGDATYDWDGNDLQGRGLYLDERPWGARVLALTRV